jgi:RNA polymerase sigma-70 factor (ECF subfamily)
MTRGGRAGEPNVGVHVSPEGGRLSRAEFEALFQGASRRLWIVAAAVMGRPDRADDVVQEAAVIALSKLEVFDKDTSFLAWMSQIVRNVARNESRRHARSGSALTDPLALDQSVEHRAEPHEVGVSLSGDVHDARGGDQQAFDDLVLAALAKLDETARACLLLRTLQDLPYREISNMLGIPEGTAMSHVHRARRAMRNQLSQDMSIGCDSGWEQT